MLIVMGQSAANLANTRFAVLTLSRGNLDKFMHYVASAKKGFRDVINSAGEEDKE